MNFYRILKFSNLDLDSKITFDDSENPSIGFGRFFSIFQILFGPFKFFTEFRKFLKCRNFCRFGSKSKFSSNGYQSIGNDALITKMSSFFYFILTAAFLLNFENLICKFPTKICKLASWNLVFLESVQFFWFYDIFKNL